MIHNWQHHTTGQGVLYVRLASHVNAMVRCKPLPDGRYLWQFRKVVSFADTIKEAMEYVEAGAEFFDVMHRNPYAN